MTGGVAMTTPVNNRNKQKKTLRAPGDRTTKNVSRKRKGAAADTKKRKGPEPTQQMEAVEEGTADNANLRRRSPLNLLSK
jgi:hypothetical protein